MNIPPPTQRQARLLWSSLTALAVAILAGLGGLVLWGLGWTLNRLSSVLLPIAFALVLAYILDPLVEYFVRKGIPRVRSILVVFSLALVLASAVLGSVVPDIIRETRELVTTLPANAARLRKNIQSFLDHSPLVRQFPNFLRSPAGAGQPQATGTNSAGSVPAGPAFVPTATNRFDVSLHLTDADEPPGGILYKGDATNASGDLETFNQVLNTPLSETVIVRLEELFKLLLRWLGSQLGKVTVWAEFLIGLVLVPVYLFYFLLEKQGITRAWADYLPLQESKIKDEVVFVLQAINDCLIVFFRGQVLIALCVGSLLTVGYLILGLNYAILIGLVAATLGIVPYLGALVSLFFALAVATLQFGDWTHPLLVVCIAGIVKLLEDFIISPKVMGQRSGLHPLTIIIAVLVGTTLLGGILGAILAIPLTAVLRTLMFRYVWIRRTYPVRAAVLEPAGEGKQP